MSFIHYLFLGHFEREGAFVRFAKESNDAAFKPVINRAIDLQAVQASVADVTGDSGNRLSFPEDWNVWLDDGWVIFNKYTGNRDAVEFVKHLVERTGCTIYDVSAHRDISLHDWLEAVEPRLQPAVPSSS